MFLTSVPFLGSIKIRILINHFGDATRACQASAKEIVSLPGFGNKIAEGWQRALQKGDWERNIDLACWHGIDLITYKDKEYPVNLLEITDFPLILYNKGNKGVLNQPSLAIVGTRSPSIYGAEVAEKFATDLAEMGFAIISGLARGIDSFAHRGALKAGGKTVGVIGSGLANIYPKENLSLAQEIAQSGTLLSEFPMETPPDRQNFPQRNRIVSALSSSGIVLIEAAKKSGAMITVEKGLAQGKPIFAVPGRIDYNSFEGNHLLIKENKAKVVFSAKDVAGMSPESVPLRSVKQTKVKPLLTVDEEKFLQIMPDVELDIEELEEITKMPVKNLNIILMSLVLKKMIKEYPGKIYKKII